MKYNILYISITPLHIILFGNHVLKSSQQTYDIVKTFNRKAVPPETLALFIFIKFTYIKDLT